MKRLFLCLVTMGLLFGVAGCQGDEEACPADDDTVAGADAQSGDDVEDCDVDPKGATFIDEENE